MKPIWLRVSPAIRSFILGEVERQYHPIGTMEYARRVEWMTDAWMWAGVRSIGHAKPTVEDMLHIAAMIEPGINRDGYRTCRIWIGGHEGTSPPAVSSEVEQLWRHMGEVRAVQGKGRVFEAMTADEFYLEFERIHPFGDGNGRTGKVLHNWLLGTLDDPVLVADYFGAGNP